MSDRIVAASLLLFMWIGCAAVKPPGAGTFDANQGAVHDYRSLVSHLRKSGLPVDAVGDVEQAFFTPKAKVIRIGDSGEAQVYEYASEEQAAAEAAKVNANGSIGTSMPRWIAPPHFFRKRSLIVLYLGSDDYTLLALRGALGNQFAGS